MNRTKRITGMLTAVMLMTALAVPSFADNGFEKGNGKNAEMTHGNAYGKTYTLRQRTELHNFSFMEGLHIMAKHKQLKFDVAPVIKEGRTLIPVRAITEAFGATVDYDEETGIVTITSEDESIIIKFYLDEEDNGKITVTRDGDTEDVTTDVRPGIINGRTFVPLRFIAETLGLKVTHDGKTGAIDIDESNLALKQVRFTFANPDVVDDIDIPYTPADDYDLVKILNGTKELDSSDYDVEDGVVTIDQDYLETLTADRTILKLVFEDQDGNEVTRTIEVRIDQEGVYTEPTLSKAGVKFFSEDEIADTVITVTLNGHTLKEIVDEDDDSLTLGDDYTISGNKITLKKAYLEDLPDGETELTLVFVSGSETVKLDFVVEK